MPAVMAAMSRSAVEVVGGYYTVTPDGRPIVGPRCNEMRLWIPVTACSFVLDL
jgi:glycine/D-amino acid oxidase-like deaminating enzyme